LVFYSELGGAFHLKKHMSLRPIEHKYREGKVLAPWSGGNGETGWMSCVRYSLLVESLWLAIVLTKRVVFLTLPVL